MKTEYLYGIIGLLGGALLAILFTTNVVNSNNTQMMKMMGMHTQNFMQEAKTEGLNQMHEQMMGDDKMTMSGMVNSLKDKTGEDFDKEFISQMIPHHQGAIEMAKLAKENGFHQEIKDMADDIISAQAKEINMMKQWLNAWGY